MSRGLLLVNLLLVVAAGYCGAQVFDLWTSPAPRDAPRPSTAAAPPSALPAAAMPRGADAAARTRTPAALSIADKNLFSPTRTESGPDPMITATAVKPAVTPPAPPPPPPPPKPFLNGVVVLESGAIAYMEDPITKRVRAYRVGDPIAGGTIEAITADHVTLNRPSGTVEVRLRDPAKPRAVATPQVPGQPRREPGALTPAPGQPVPAPGTAPGQILTPTRPFPPNLLRRVPPPTSGDAPTP